jgi:hypothetical protein
MSCSQYTKNLSMGVEDWHGAFIPQAYGGQIGLNVHVAKGETEEDDRAMTTVRYRLFLVLIEQGM